MRGIRVKQIQKTVARTAVGLSVDTGKGRRGLWYRLQTLPTLRDWDKAEPRFAHVGKNCQGVRAWNSRTAGTRSCATAKNYEGSGFSKEKGQTREKTAEATTSKLASPPLRSGIEDLFSLFLLRSSVFLSLSSAVLNLSTLWED
jgi:hypothetical protein